MITCHSSTVAFQLRVLRCESNKKKKKKKSVQRDERAIGDWRGESKADDSIEFPFNSIATAIESLAEFPDPYDPSIRRTIPQLNSLNN